MTDITCDTIVLLPGMMCDERLFACQAEDLKQEEQRPIEVIIPRLDNAKSIQGLASKVLAEHGFLSSLTIAQHISYCGR